MSLPVFRSATAITTFALGGAGALLLALSACAPSDGPSATPTPTVSSSQESATPSPSPSVSAVSGTPVNVSCDQLISLQALYDYNPNIALDAQYVPEVDSLASQAIKDRGLACAWVNQTSGEQIVVTVTQPGGTHLSDIANELVSSSNAVPTYQVEGYFQMNGNVGVAQVISDPYWITASSTSFLEPGDAAPIVAATRVGLGQ
jgi:hypothetical protein